MRLTPLLLLAFLRMGGRRSLIINGSLTYIPKYIHTVYIPFIKKVATNQHNVFSVFKKISDIYIAQAASHLPLTYARRPCPSLGTSHTQCSVYE